MTVGDKIYALACELFPIGRSLTGKGVRDTLAILRRELPSLQIHEVPSGTQSFDWTVPDEWNVRDAYVIGPSGNKVIDYQVHNLHLVGYSEPVDCELPLSELQSHLHSLPNQPDAIPYVTSYYRRTWGFCLTETQRRQLPAGNYRVHIDSTLAPGSMTYGDLVIPGASDEEIFLSTYVCHPSMANNELSGPTLACHLAKWVESAPRRYTYRFVFIPETIGAITYLSRHLPHLKQHVKGGFNISCVGDDRVYSYLASRQANTISDRVAQHTLQHVAGDYIRYTFLQRGSDERQYCSPGVDLPICAITRSKYGAYPEYHTSLDNLGLVTPAGLGGSYEVFRRALECFEFNRRYQTQVLCEPQLGKRGLYPTLSKVGSVSRDVSTISNIVAYSDGSHDLLAIADLIDRPLWEVAEFAAQLASHDLIREVPA